MTDGKPNLNGVWQAITTANWDIQDHSAAPGPFWQLGAIGAIPAGQGIVEGNEIPYTPAGLAKKKQNAEKWLTLDPEDVRAHRATLVLQELIGRHFGRH